MKKIFILLITLLGFGPNFAYDKVHQAIVERDNKVLILENQREYEALQVVTVKYLDLSNLQNHYSVIRHNKLNYADIEKGKRTYLILWVLLGYLLLQ